MAEKKSTIKSAESKVTTAKKTTIAKKSPSSRKSTAKKVEILINANNVGFKAGDVYQALATSKKSMSVAEIAKAAKIEEEEVLLGMGWLFKEGKIKDDGNKVVLA